MTQGSAMDNALATDGYYFSSEAFQAQTQIEATQLACLLGTNTDTQAEVILEVRSMDDDTDFQLALTGQLRVIDSHQTPISCEQLRQLPLDQLQEQQLTESGWTITERPHFAWLKQRKPLGYGFNSIQTCAIDELNSLRTLLQNQAFS
ncbi:MAG: hypothetical protein V7752_18425 [Halopseudomonas sp.]